MEHLHWPLTVLARAVHHKNLTAASGSVGLSQPQLSRLVSQLERELDLVLLDRAAKRKSGWTHTAFQLAEVYSDYAIKFQNSITAFQSGARPKQTVSSVGPQILLDLKES